MGLPLLNSLLTIRTWLKQQKKCCHNYEITEKIIKKIGTKDCYYKQSDCDCDEENNILDIINLD